MAFLQWLSSLEAVSDELHPLLVSCGVPLSTQSRGECCKLLVGAAEYNAYNRYHKKKQCAMMRTAAGQLLARLHQSGSD